MSNLPAFHAHSTDRQRRLAAIAAALLVAPALFLLSRSNYLLFHGLVEVAGVVVAFTLFAIGWNTRFLIPTGALQVLAAGYLGVAGISLLHLFAYRGMAIFPDNLDLPTQLWIAARIVEGVTFLTAAVLLGRNVRSLTPERLLLIFLGGAFLLLLTIWPWGIFPACLVDGVGLTPFKRGTEILFMAGLALAAGIGYQRRHYLPRGVRRPLLYAVFFSILASACFTFYTDVYGITNFLGHYGKLLSMLLVYRALIHGALRDPYRVFFHDLATSREALALQLEQRRRAEDELKAAYRELDAFVRTVSHDLRGPLTPIIGFASHLQQQLQGRVDGAILEQLGAIEERGWHMLVLLEDLLEFARIGHTSRPLQLVNCDEVVQEVLEELGQELLTSGAKVHSYPCPPITAHRSLIYQLFTNLIRNAVRYGGRPGTSIRIGGCESVAEVCYYVSDQGPGVATEEREQIFETFYRGRDEVERPGSGLGLAIVQKVARFYGGRVWVEETPGGGSTFQVELPRAYGAVTAEMSAAVTTASGTYVRTEAESMAADANGSGVWQPCCGGSG